ncbi:hypothetical protein [Arthrobacter sp. SRS-W-1-2016]|uniref:hypothetical protein n=1 Tax=Arthrobacter sp. SRS-W-1-2016 TaxID=1930254 RepID=UPI001C0B558F|nr:hypothetical protein [Arthrobacter sp. SRS-W-1-2016]
MTNRMRGGQRSAIAWDTGGPPAPSFLIQAATDISDPADVAFPGFDSLLIG